MRLLCDWQVQLQHSRVWVSAGLSAHRDAERFITTKKQPEAAASRGSTRALRQQPAHCTQPKPCSSAARAAGGPWFCVRASALAAVR